MADTDNTIATLCDRIFSSPQFVASINCRIRLTTLKNRLGMETRSYVADLSCLNIAVPTPAPCNVNNEQLGLRLVLKRCWLQHSAATSKACSINQPMLLLVSNTFALTSPLEWSLSSGLVLMTLYSMKSLGNARWASRAPESC
jgi:hypothetical protein